MGSFPSATCFLLLRSDDCWPRLIEVLPPASGMTKPLPRPSISRAPLLSSSEYVVPFLRAPLTKVGRCSASSPPRYTWKSVVCTGRPSGWLVVGSMGSLLKPEPSASTYSPAKK